jgi:hypothetical protein
MRFSAVAMFVVLFAPDVASGQAAPAHGAAPTPLPARHAWTRPAQLPMLPSLSRVRVEAARDHVTVLEDIGLPRGEWQQGGLDMYIAFGSPGPPLAVDAHLLVAPARDGPIDADAAGDALAMQPAVHPGASTQVLLGPPQMVGVVVHVRDADLRRAYAASDIAGVRLRSLLAPPPAEPGGAREIVVRLGIAGGLPMTIGRLQVLSLEPAAWMHRAEATLCGPDADVRPLALALSPKPAAPHPPSFPAESPIAPAMAVRHASDALCIRWWSEP